VPPKIGGLQPFTSLLPQSVDHHSRSRITQVEHLIILSQAFHLDIGFELTGYLRRHKDYLSLISALRVDKSDLHHLDWLQSHVRIRPVKEGEFKGAR
jgi:hypothetical protein